MMKCILFCLSILVPVSLQSSKPDREIRRWYLAGEAQGTTYHITYYADSALVSKGQVDSIFQKLDSSLSAYKPYSLLSRFNTGQWSVAMDVHLEKVVRKSLDTYNDSKGLFDITVEPLVRAWGFGTWSVDSAPGKKQIRALKKCVGSKYLVLDGNRLGKRKDCIRIDVNGIAQGYSVDVVANYFEERGVSNYIVELGGEIRVKGRKLPGDEKFRVGIEVPGAGDYDLSSRETIVLPGEGALTTSGNYRKFRESGGRKISHLINPHTGFPANNELISVTVYAGDAITADAYDNVLMLLGLQKALRFVEKRKFLAAHFIYRDSMGKIRDTASSRFLRLVQN